MIDCDDDAAFLLEKLKDAATMQIRVLIDEMRNGNSLAQRVLSEKGTFGDAGLI